MLSNAYFLAKFRFDTAENEPAKNLQNFRKMHFSKMHFQKSHGRTARSGKLHRARSRLYRGQILQENMRLKALAEIYTMHSFAQLCKLKFCQKFANISAKFCNFLAGSFSAVSKRNFARKYAFDSIFQALQDLPSFAPLQSQNFRKKSV